METIIYQQADNSAKQPAVTLQFPDALPGNEAQNTECEKICEEIRCILQHAAIGHVMSTNVLTGNAQAKPEESL